MNKSSTKGGAQACPNLAIALSRAVLNIEKHCGNRSDLGKRAYRQKVDGTDVVWERTGNKVSTLFGLYLPDQPAVLNAVLLALRSIPFAGTPKVEQRLDGETWFWVELSVADSKAVDQWLEELEGARS